MTTINQTNNKPYKKLLNTGISLPHPPFSNKINELPTRFDLFFKKFTNLLMIDGKKIKASLLIFNMLIILKKKIKKDFEKKTSSQDKIVSKSSLKDRDNNNQVIFNKEYNLSSQKKIRLNFTLLRVIFKALENITPSVEVRKVRVAGSTYIVPAVLSKKKQETLALKWIIESAKKRQKNSKFDFSTCLADEILDASKKLGQARQKRDELHRTAQMNRAYIRYRWW